MNRDVDHLDALAVSHYILSGLVAATALLKVFGFGLGLFMVLLAGQVGRPGSFPLAFFGWFFIVLALGAVLAGLAFALCILIAGRGLARRKRYLFCLAMGGVECLVVPFGTALGIFTLFVLMRDSVKALFREPGAPYPSA